MSHTQLVQLIVNESCLPKELARIVSQLYRPPATQLRQEELNEIIRVTSIPIIVEIVQGEPYYYHKTLSDTWSVHYVPLMTTSANRDDLPMPHMVTIKSKTYPGCAPCSWRTFTAFY